MSWSILFCRHYKGYSVSDPKQQDVTHVLNILDPKTREVLRCAGYDHYPTPEDRKCLEEAWGCSCIIEDAPKEFVDTMQFIWRKHRDEGGMRVEN